VPREDDVCLGPDDLQRIRSTRNRRPRRQDLETFADLRVDPLDEVCVQARVQP
jgi:hypothetical protein